MFGIKKLYIHFYNTQVGRSYYYKNYFSKTFILLHRQKYSSTMFLNWEHSFLKQHILGSMLSILERNGEKRNDKLSLFSNYSLD